jgi:DNA-binding transcriptional regulator PaaX
MRERVHKIWNVIGLERKIKPNGIRSTELRFHEPATLLAKIVQVQIDLAPIVAAARALVEACFDLHTTVDQYLATFAACSGALLVRCA